MSNGTVKFFNAAKGFGFITPDDGGKDFFVPAASLAAAGLAGVKAGQRVSFDTEPDGKGPKAVNITLLAEAPQPPPPKPPLPNGSGGKPAAAPPDAAKPPLTFYHDPANAGSCKALEKLLAAGHQPRVVDYLATPPAQDDLKSLSLQLRSADQSLVRKYDPLFLELCLDDRFISESEFWGAIIEHPRLINGPIVATPAKASVCQSDKAVDAFLAALSSGWVPPPPARKRLPDSLLQMVTGGAAPPAPTTKAVEVPATVRPDGKSPKAVKAPAPEPKSIPAAKAAKTPSAKPKARPAAKAKTKAKPKPAEKSKKPAKPAQKARPAHRK